MYTLYILIIWNNRLAPEHTERIAGSIVLSHCELTSLMSSQMSKGFDNALFSDLQIEVQVIDRQLCYAMTLI